MLYDETVRQHDYNSAIPITITTVPGADKPDSGFRPSGVGKMRSN